MGKEELGFILFAIVCLLIVIVGFVFTKRKIEGKPKRTKYIVRGITMIFVMTPFLTIVVGAVLELFIPEGGGWMLVLSIIYLAPILFVIGLILLLIGLFTKKEIPVDS